MIFSNCLILALNCEPLPSRGGDAEQILARGARGPGHGQIVLHR